MRIAGSFVFFGLSSLLALAPRTAAADLERITSEATIDVTVASDHRSLRIEGGKPLPVTLREEQSSGAKDWPASTKGRRIDLGGGKSVVHVALPLATGGAYEVVASNAGEELFSGVTGLSGESAALRLMTTSGRTPTLVRAKTDDRVRLCGQNETLLAPQGLDPKTWTWKGASLQQLGTAARAAAKALTAVETEALALPQVLLLDAHAASSGEPRAATDGDAATAWSEGRPGVGQGEFLIAAAEGAPLRGLTMLLGDREGNGAPAAFFVLTDSAIFRVSAPAPKSSTAWTRVDFPEAVSTRCLAIVLDTAHAEGREASVSIREVRATTDLDADPEAAVALARLAVVDESLRRLLGRASATGRATLAREFWNLTPEARRAILETLEPQWTCEDLAELEALALADPKLTPSATRFFDRCTMRASPGLLRAFAASKAPVRGAMAGTVALLGRRAAIEPLVGALGEGDRATRAHVRAALARVLESAASDTDRAKVASDGARLSASAFTDLLSSFGSRVGEHGEAFVPRVRELAAATDVGTRWDLTPSLAVFAERGSLVEAYAALLRSDEPALRVHATRSAPRRLASALLDRTKDSSPRVREAALDRLTELAASREDAAIAALTDDFAFVRVAAARALATVSGPGPETPAAAKALELRLTDRALRVRVAALDSLAARPSTPLAVFEQLAFEPAAPYELRVSALTALGLRCRTSDPTQLEALARKIGRAADAGDARVAFAAFAALAQVKPAAAARIRAEVAASPQGPGKNRSFLAGLDQALASPACRAQAVKGP